MTTCPECGSFRTKKYGWRKNKRGTFQRYMCKDCGRQFIDDDFLWMQTPKHAVACAMRLWKRGMEPSQIMEEVWLVFRIKRSVYALYYWVKKFLHLFEAVNAVPLHGISNRLHWDYTYIKINGEDAYFWALKDSVRKAIVGWVITVRRGIEDAKSSLRQTKRMLPPSCDLDDLEIVTDKEPSFPRAIWEIFGHGTKHYQYKGFKDKKNNNLIEELWRFKNYMPEFRAIEQANRFFTIWVALYNIKRVEHVARSHEAYKLSKFILFRRISTFNFCG